MKRRGGGDRGFTLLEVMIALGILFAAMVVLVGSSNANVKASVRAKFLTVATGLARAKMLQIEEEILHTGFQDTSETMEGDFGEEGYPKFAWSAMIEKVELPGAGALQQAQSESAASGRKGPEAVAGLMGVTDPTAAAGASMLMSQFDLIKGVLENSIRKVTLTVKWRAMNEDEQLVVVCYFTDPKAVDNAMLGGSPSSSSSSSSSDTSGRSSR